MNPPSRPRATSTTTTAVLITATETEPRRFGKQVVLGGILDHLVSRLGADHVHVLLVGPADQDRPVVTYHRRVLAKPGALRQATSVIQWTVLPSLFRRGPLSLQEAVLRSPRLRQQIASALTDIGADLEIWDTVRMGQYAPSIPNSRARRILYADDLFSVRYAAMLRESDFGDAGGQFASILPRPARRVLANPRAQRTLLRAEQRLVAQSETRQPSWFERTLLVSDEETDVLRTRLGRGPEAPAVNTLPPLLRPQQPVRQSADLPQPEFTFIGGFAYAANRQGLDWFLRECRSEVLTRIPDVCINVIGAGTECGLGSAAAWGGAVKFLGWVDDLDSVLRRTRALLSPLRSGSGIKIKVLEALSRGLPVVATSAGVQGIARSSRSGGAGFLVGDDPQAIAEAMASVCDPTTHDRLARAARRTWDRLYSPSVVEGAYDEFFGLGDRRISGDVAG